MFSLNRFTIIYSIFAFGNCIEKQNKEKNLLEIPIHVHRDSTDTIEFQFNKTLEIEPIALKVDEINFQLLEDKNVKKFRNTIPLDQKEREIFSIILEYLEPGKQEKQVKPFEYNLKDSQDDIITIQIKISLPQIHKQSETSMRNNQKTVIEIFGTDDETDIRIHPFGRIETKASSSDFEETNSNYKNAPEDEISTFSIDDDEEENSCDNDGDELLNTALRHSKLGTHLILKGLKDSSKNPVDTIRDIIVLKLDLPHLEYRILQAKYIDEGLLFEMSSQKDVVEILSKVDLIKSDDLFIELTTAKIYDFTIDVRSGF